MMINNYEIPPAKYSCNFKNCVFTSTICAVHEQTERQKILAVFKHYRDTILLSQPDKHGYLRDYYTPMLGRSFVSCINSFNNSAEIYTYLWDKYINPFYQLLLDERYDEAFPIYFNLVDHIIFHYIVLPSEKEG